MSRLPLLLIKWLETAVVVYTVDRYYLYTVHGENRTCYLYCTCAIECTDVRRIVGVEIVLVVIDFPFSTWPAPAPVLVLFAASVMSGVDTAVATGIVDYNMHIVCSRRNCYYSFHRIEISDCTVPVKSS